MTIENAKVQYEILKGRKDTFHMAQLEKRFPELKEPDNNDPGDEEQSESPPTDQPDEPLRDESRD